MLCPKCGNRYSPHRVIDTWPVFGGSATRRRVECGRCGAIYYTEERVADRLTYRPRGERHVETVLRDQGVIEELGA